MRFLNRFTLLQAFAVSGLRVLSIQFNSIKTLDSRIFAMETMRQIFASNNLFQRVPDGLANFKMLTHVSFPYNKISSVGHSLCCCTMLNYLDLSNNQISALASEFFNLWNLKYLNFASNSFETIGDSIKCFSDLQYLNLSYNFLSDLSFSGKAMLTSLEEVDLTSNKLTNLPTWLGCCPNMKILQISVNDLRSPPPEVLRLGQSFVILFLVMGTHVYICIIQSYELTHYLQQMCASLKGADTLELNDQGFVSLPAEFTIMSSLTKLSLNRNVLSSLPATISDLSSLSIFCVRNNRIILVPPELSLCVNMITLDLGQNLISRIPQELCSLKRMRNMSLDSNRLIYVPAAIFGWHQLQVINLSNQRTISSISLVLDALQEEQLPPLRRGVVVKLPAPSFKQVQTFEAASCSIDDIHIWLHKVASLQCLILPDNKLKQLPTTMDMWPMLQIIDVRHNEVQSLPTSIGNCTNVVNLLLDDNKLSQLPSGLTNLNALSQLGLSYNLLSEVPFSFRRFTNMTILRISNNPFRALPAGIGALKNLECDVARVW